MVTEDDKKLVKEALKSVKNPSEVFVAIHISYSKRLYLPLKDGLSFISSIEKGLVVDEIYANSIPEFIGLGRDLYTFEIVGIDEIERLKAAEVLQVTCDEIRELKIT